MNRKDFITALARVSILSVMTLMTGVFVFRNKVTVQSECTVNRYCKGCGKLADCKLPRAKKERRNV